MNFLHPWALGIGAAAIGLPLLVHWLTKPRPVRMPLSTVRFVMEAVRQRRARYRLRDWIVLLLRALAVALIAWAFARPLGGAAAPLVPADAAAGTARVVVVDQSQSNAAVAANGVAAFDRAKPAAAKYLAGASGTRANLILAGARPRPVFDALSANVAALRDGLSAAKPLAERLDLRGAVARAGEMLAAAPPGGRRELVIVSDFQRADWAAADFAPLPADVVIQLESVAPSGDTPANLAVQRVAAAGRVEQGREVVVEVDVGNYSRVARQVQAELTLGASTYRLEGLCPPGVKSTLTTTVVPRDAGWQTGEARLLSAEDALPADNARPFVLNVKPAPTYVLLTREPAKPQAVSSHFVERALAPGAAARRTIDATATAAGPVERVQRVDSKAVPDKDALAAADLIVVDHPGKLPAETVELLANLVRRGRGLLYVAAEPVDATNLKLFADAAGDDLKMPVKFLPPQAGQVRRDLTLAETRQDQPPFREFGEGLSAAIGPLRFSGGLSTQRDEAGLLDDIQATYSDRSACLVTTAFGAGVVCVLNADLAASNLPASPVFVPMIAELVGRLLGRATGDAAVASGERLDAVLPPDAGSASAGLSLAGPAGVSANDLGALSDQTSAVLWTWPAAGPPGVYSVKRGATIVYAVATAIPASEADLAPLDPAVLTGRLAGGRKVAFASAAAGDDAGRNDRIWAWVLAACCACLLLELMTLLAFRA